MPGSAAPGTSKSGKFAVFFVVCHQLLFVRAGVANSKGILYFLNVY